MIAKTPTPVRWAEEAEAGRVCTLALLEPEPERAASRPTQIAAECSFFQAMLLRCCGRLGLSRQKKRDVDWTGRYPKRQRLSPARRDDSGLASNRDRFGDTNGPGFSFSARLHAWGLL
jgi:hypothetical protein